MEKRLGLLLAGTAAALVLGSWIGASSREAHETVTVRTDRTGSATLRVPYGRVSYTASLGDAYRTWSDEAADDVAVVLTR